MRIFKNKEDSLKFGLSLFFIVGSMLGTVFCNMMTEEMKRELVTMETSGAMGAVARTRLAEVDFGSLMIRVLPERLWMLVVVMLAAATPMAVWLLRLIVGYLGFSCAVSVSALTMIYGVFGILRYMAMVFPQCLCYGMAGYLLLWWMPVKEKQLTGLSVLVLIGLVCAGSGLECFVNPWIITIV